MESLRRTIFRSAAHIGTGPARTVIEIVNDDKIEPTVAIVIDERRRRAPENEIKTGRACDVSEGAVAIVEEQPRAAVLRNEHIRKAVIVYIADGHTHAITGDVQPRAGADIAKGAVFFLMQETIG